LIHTRSFWSESGGRGLVAIQADVKDNSFLTLVLDQLHDFGEVYARVMFGGHGLYRNRVFFAIVYDGRLYFKTDDRSRGRYLEFGMKPFRPNLRQALRSSIEVPGEVLESPSQLAQWALEAVATSTGKVAS
jgi:DNA transformation protein and related proteins